MLNYVAEKKKVRFIQPEVSLEEAKLYSQIYEDKSRFLQVLINFLSNALKFSNNDSEIKINLRLNQQ